jgi:lipopolysaccharide assembly protein A
MLFFLIIGLLLGAVAVIFALQNITTISVTFFTWQVDGSLALILMLAIVAGVLISILVSIPEVIRTHMRISGLKKQNKKLEDEIARLREVRTPVVENTVTEKTTVTETTNSNL